MFRKNATIMDCSISLSISLRKWVRIGFNADFRVFHLLDYFAFIVWQVVLRLGNLHSASFSLTSSR